MANDVILTDGLVKALAFTGLAIYGAAAALTISSRIGHWPLTICLLVLTLSAIVLLYMDGFNWLRDHPYALVVCVCFLGAAIWQVVAASRWSMAAVIVAVSLQCLFLIALLLFLYLFRLDRLW